MKKAIIIFVFSIPIFSFSQVGGSNNSIEYFDSMRDKLNLKLEFDNDLETFEFNDQIIKYSVKPNTSLRTVLGFNYRFLGFKIGYSPKFLAPEDFEKKGRTKVFKISTDIFIRRWVQSFEYSDVKGYYVEEIGNSDENQDNPAITVLPNLKSQIIRGKTSFVVNKNLSTKAIINQVEIQRKSAGSFVPSLTYVFFNFSDVNSLTQTQSLNFIFNANYTYTFIINRKWYANIGLAPGIGVGINELTENETVLKSNDIIVNFNSNINLGYNSKNFYAGISYKLEVSTPGEESVIEYDSIRSVFNLSFGYRFNPPKFLKKSFDWVSNHTPLK